LNAHATGTPLGDAAEARAIRSVFGDVTPPVSGTKGLYGHPLGASGAIEVAITALALERGWLPPTHNLLGTDADCELTFVAPGGTGLTSGGSSPRGRLSGRWSGRVGTAGRGSARVGVPGNGRGAGVQRRAQADGPQLGSVLDRVSDPRALGLRRGRSPQGRVNA